MPVPTDTRRGHRGRSLFAFWLILALLWFLPLNAPHLFDPDEGRYGEIPREMVASGDWVTPRLDAIKYFEKPALQYWATALAYELFGQRAWTARLWPALCGFLGLLLSWALARRLYDERTAMLAVIVQASALLYVGLARFTTLDMSLSFSLQIAMSALVLLLRRAATSPAVAPAGAVAAPAGAVAAPAGTVAAATATATATDAGAGAGAGAWRWSLLLGLGVALAVLSKGLVGILIPGAVTVLFMIIYREPRALLRLQPWWSTAVLLGLATPWFVLVSVRNPEFPHFFFVFEHFQRYLSRAGFDRFEPFWFFVPVLALGLLPWTTLLPRAIAEGARAARSGDRAAALLLIWALFVFVFFSLSQSKLVPYILPTLPALSLLIARALARLPAARFAAHLRAVSALAAGIGAIILLLWRVPAAGPLARASTASILGFASAFLLLALGAALGVRLSRRGHVVAAAAAAAIGSLLLVQAALLAAEQLPRMRAVVELEQHLRPWVSGATRVYCVGDYLQPIPFYLQRPCTLVGYRGELDFGLQQEPWLALADLKQFALVWQQQSNALAILRPEDYRQLEALGAPMHVIYTAPSFVAVQKP